MTEDVASPVAAAETLEIHLPDGVSREFLLHYGICPLGLTESGFLRVAVRSDTTSEALDDLEIVYGRTPVGELVSGDQLELLVERLTRSAETSFEIERGDSDTGWESGLATDVRDLANQPPVVRYVSMLIREAYDIHASDIHLENTSRRLSVRFRVDGVLVPAPEPPSEIGAAVVSRIKLLADADISERRRPQDGRVRVRMDDRELDLRVSTVPTYFGESVVLRLLDRGGRPITFDSLGMPKAVRGVVETLAKQPHGLMLVTGPTGSGKTTTLYAAIAARDSIGEKIVTVEDPIEYHLAGVTQVPVHRQAGVTFPSALRSILRQDPDVVMIGEMRDPETAEIAVQAALTGHQVLSTLHTNDALGALPRLTDLGVPKYLITATLEGILAQRLVRKICDACRIEYDPPRAAVERLRELVEGTQTPEFTRGAGCSICRGTGYRGRIGLFELVLLTDAMKSAIADEAPTRLLRLTAQRAGMQTLAEDAWEKVSSGATTIEEVLRVIQFAR